MHPSSRILGTDYTAFTFFSMIQEDLTRDIIQAAHEVHHELGYGFKESVYQNALYKELKKRGHNCECQKEIKVYYKNEIVGVFIPDMIVDGVVILELKAVKDLSPEHEWQLINYLKASSIEVGLVINFGISVQVKRKIFSHNRIKE